MLHWNDSLCDWWLLSALKGLGANYWKLHPSTLGTDCAASNYKWMAGIAKNSLIVLNWWPVKGMAFFILPSTKEPVIWYSQDISAVLAMHEKWKISGKNF